MVLVAILPRNYHGYHPESPRIASRRHIHRQYRPESPRALAKHDCHRQYHPESPRPLDRPRLAALLLARFAHSCGAYFAGDGRAAGPFHSHPVGWMGWALPCGWTGCHVENGRTGWVSPAAGRADAPRHARQPPHASPADSLVRACRRSPTHPSHGLARDRLRTLLSVGSCRRHASQRAPTAPLAEATIHTARRRRHSGTQSRSDRRDLPFTRRLPWSRRRSRSRPRRRFPDPVGQVRR